MACKEFTIPVIPAPEGFDEGIAHFHNTLKTRRGWSYGKSYGELMMRQLRDQGKGEKSV